MDHLTSGKWLKGIPVVFFLLFFFAAYPVAQTPAPGDIGSFDIAKVNKEISAPGAGAPGAPSADSARLSSSPLKTSSASLFWILLRIAGSLVLVVVCIYGVVWLLKKLGVTGSSKPSAASMDVLEVLPIGQNRTLMLVRVLDEVFLIGQTPAHINLIEKITGDKAIEVMSSSKGGVSIAQFKDVFNNFMGKFTKTP